MVANSGPDQQRTALITGASGGIGEALAGIFAAMGFDLMLVARDETRLRAVGEALSGRHGVRYTAIPADLSVDGAVGQLVHGG